MAMSKEQMVLEIDNYFTKIEQLLNTTGGQRYITGTIPGNGSVVYDAPAIFGYTQLTHYVYSLSIDLKMVDPFVLTDPPVRPATAVIDFTIAQDGKVTFVNNHTTVVTYFARVTGPLVK